MGPNQENERSRLLSAKEIARGETPLVALRNAFVAELDLHFQVLDQAAGKALYRSERRSGEEKARVFDQVVREELGERLFSDALIESSIFPVADQSTYEFYSEMERDLHALVRQVPGFGEFTDDGRFRHESQGTSDGIDLEGSHLIDWHRTTPKSKSALIRARDALGWRAECSAIRAESQCGEFRYFVPDGLVAPLERVRSTIGAFDGSTFPEVPDTAFMHHFRGIAGQQVTEEDLVRSRNQIFGAKFAIERFVHENSESFDRLLGRLEACETAFHQAISDGRIDSRHQLLRDVSLILRMTAVLVNTATTVHFESALLRDSVYAAAAFASLTVGLRDDIQKRIGEQREMR